MASTLADFTLSAAAAPDDFIVGYDEAALNGERRWTVSTIAKAVSGVASLGTVKSVTGTAPISVANGTTTPAISIAAATTSAAGSMSSIDKTRLDDASGVNGLVKCNGSGDFSAAVAGTDYLVGGGSAITSTNTAKAWVNFDGYTVPGTIRSSFNVSSVTKNATGNYTINFTTAMSNTNYSVLGTTMNIATMTVQVDSINWYSAPTTKTTSAVRVNCATPSINYDCSEVYVAIFGN